MKLGESQNNLSQKGCLGDFWVTFQLVLGLNPETGQRTSLEELTSLHHGRCLRTPTPSPLQLRHRRVWVHQLCEHRATGDPSKEGDPNVLCERSTLPATTWRQPGCLLHSKGQCFSYHPCFSFSLFLFIFFLFFSSSFSFSIIVHYSFFFLFLHYSSSSKSIEMVFRSNLYLQPSLFHSSLVICYSHFVRI